MAPGLTETTTTTVATTTEVQPHLKLTNVLSLKSNLPNAIGYTPGRSKVAKYDESYEYDDLRPRFPDIHWEPLGELPYHDKGLLGDANFKNLLGSGTEARDYTPKIGTEISGVDLANLTDAQKNDLARLIATRGVVFFRDQKNFGIEQQKDLGEYFGQLHKHATTAVPRREGLEDVHVVFTGEDSPDLRAMFAPSFLWHSDVSLHATLIANRNQYPLD
jgi:sulfonate dioxygenase